MDEYFQATHCAGSSCKTHSRQLSSTSFRSSGKEIPQVRRLVAHAIVISTPAGTPVNPLQRREEDKSRHPARPRIQTHNERTHHGSRPNGRSTTLSLFADLPGGPAPGIEDRRTRARSDQVQDLPPRNARKPCRHQARSRFVCLHRSWPVGRTSGSASQSPVHRYGSITLLGARPSTS